MGRKPTPTAIKKRLGNPGKRPLNENEPEPDGRPNAPSYLDEYGQRVWRRVIQSMTEGVYTRCDTETLAAYCQACSLHRIAVLVIQKGRFAAKTEGIITETLYRDNNGRDWIRIQKEQAAALASLGSRLGLDPSARTAIKVPEKPKSGKFAQFRRISGGKG